MATYTVTTINWNSPAFWAAINVVDGDTLDLSLLPATFTVSYDEAADNRLVIFDGTSTFIVGGSGDTSGTNATLASGQFDAFDTMELSGGSDTVTTGAGSQTISGEGGDDVISAGAGNDEIFGGGNSDTLTGGEGDDTIIGGTGSDSISGGDDADLLIGDIVGGSYGYIVGSNGSLYTYSPLTGETEIVTTGLQATGDIAQTPDGTLYGVIFSGGAASNAGVYEIDPATGNETLVFDLSDTSNWASLASDFDGNLYLTNDSNGDLIQLTPDGSGGFTGVTTPGALPLSVKDIVFLDEDTAWATANGVIYQYDVDAAGNFTNETNLGAVNGQTDIWGLSLGDDGMLYAYEGSGEVWMTDPLSLPLAWAASTPTDLGGAQIWGASSIINDAEFAGDDTIDGGAGNDQIFGGAGGDSLTGGTGVDTIYGGIGNDSIAGSDTDTVYGGEGDDEISMGYTAVGGTAYGEDGNDTLTGNNGVQSLYGGDGADTIYGGDDFTTFDEDLLDGGAGDDVIVSGATGTATSETWQVRGDTLVGGDGNDSLTGGAADDTLIGGADNDTMDGGGGRDTFVFEDGFGTDTVTGGEVGPDEDTLDFTAISGDVDVNFSGPEAGTATSGSDTVTFTEIEEIETGSGDDSIVGSSGSETITTGAGADTINTGAGDDVVNLGADSTGDTIILTDGFGSDVISGFDAPTDDGDGTFTGTDLFDVTGLTDGTSPVNTHDVTVSDDGSGNAVLSFPNGESVTLTGIDPTLADNPQWLNAIGIPLPDGTVSGTAGNDIIDDSYANDPDGDMVDAADEVILGHNTDDDLIEAGAGDDTIVAGAGDDTISGEADADFILVDSGDGNDTIFGGETGTDTDTLDLNDTSAGAGVTVAMTGAEDGNYSFDGTSGAGTFDGIENVYLTQEGDTYDASATSTGVSVTGEAGDDSLTGGTGGDTLLGGSGDDTIDGGDGDDVILGDTTTDMFDSAGGDITYEYWSVGSGLSSLSDAGFDSYGNNPTLPDGSGVTDTFDVNAVDTEQGGTGDLYAIRYTTELTVTAGGTYTLSVVSDDGIRVFVDGVEVIANDTLHAPATDTGTIDLAPGSYTVEIIYFENTGGNVMQPSISGPDTGGSLISLADANISQSYDDSLSGGAGNDTVDGGLGDDVLDGGLDDDSLSGSAGTDTITIDEDDGTDTIAGGEDTDGSDIDTIDFSESGSGQGVTVTFDGDEQGTYDFDGTASSGDFEEIEAIDGTSEADTVDASADTSGVTVTGNAGDDVITGGQGDDSLTGGDDADTFLVQDNFGTDTIVGGQGGNNYDTLDLSSVTNPVTVTFTGPGAGTITDTVTGDVLTFSEIEQLILTDQADTVDATLDDGYTYIQTLEGADSVLGSDGDDVYDDEIGAGIPNDGAGNDTFYGGAGNDEIWAGNDNDTVFGGSGDDTLSGQAGDDTLDGGTGADTLDGETGNDQITFADGDTAYGGDGDDTFIAADLGEPTNGTITIEGGDNAETLGGGDTLQLGTLADITTLNITGSTTNASGNTSLTGSVLMDDGTTLNFTGIESVICFTPGTRIATPYGVRNVEDLKPGDQVVTRDHGLQKLRWIGKRMVPARGRFAPIRIRPGVVCGQVSDLVVSPQHRMLFTGYRAQLLFGESEVLASALHLVDGIDVTQEEGDFVTYIHLLFDEHEVIFAEGAATESFHPGGTGMTSLDNAERDELFTLFPELRTDLGRYGDTARRCLKKHEALMLRD